MRGGEWRLVVRRVEGDWTEANFEHYYFKVTGVLDDPQPLVNAPRSVRIFAMPKVQAIVDTLAEQAENCLGAVAPVLSEDEAPQGPPPASDVPF